MATLIELTEEGTLIEIDPGLDEDELPWRRLLGTVKFIEWLDQEMPSLSHNPLYGDLDVEEQVFAVFDEYVQGEEFLDDRRFKKLSWTSDHYVWELKTDDIRIFGWVPQKDVYICCFGDKKDNVETLGLYGRYIALTVYERDNCELAPPKFVMSKKVEDVVSTKN